MLRDNACLGCGETMMPNTNAVPVPGSYRPPSEGAHALGPVAPDSVVRLTVQLAPRDPQGLAAKIETPGYRPYTRDEFVQAHAPSNQDIATVQTYLETNGLTVSAIVTDRLSLAAMGTVANAERAFGTQVMAYDAQGQRFRANTGPLTVPADVAPLVEGIFGLDTRPVAQPRHAAKSLPAT